MIKYKIFNIDKIFSGSESLLGSRKRLLCQYLVKYLPDVLKNKQKVMDIFYTDKKCIIKFYVD